MAISIPTEDRAKVEDALRNPDGTEVSLNLDIDGRQVGDKVLRGDWGADNTGVISCDLTLSGRLPLSADDTRSDLSVFVEGIEIPQMAGYVSLPQIEEDKASTKFLAASAGAEAGRTTLDEVLEYSGWEPSRVVRHVLRRLPYPAGKVRVDALKEPLLYFTLARQTNFWPEQFVSDVLSMVEKQTAYVLRDTAEGGFVATPSLEGSQVASPGRIYNANDFIKWRPPPRKERRYSDVVVHKRNDGGLELFSYSATVPYRGKNPPQKHTALYISIDDESPEAPERARRLAYHMAANLSRGTFSDTSAILPYFDPFVEIGDIFQTNEEWEDMDGLWDRSWVFWVDAYKHDWEALTTEIAYTGFLLKNEKIDSPALIVPGISGGVTRLLWGEYGQSYFYIDESMPWITDNSDYFTIDETLSGGVVTQSGDYFTVN